MNNVRGLSFYAFLVFVLFLISMEMWIGWGRKPQLMGAFAILTLLYGFGYKLFKIQGRYLLALLILYITYFFISVQFSTQTFFTQTPSILIPFFCVLCVRDIYKSRILDLITKWYAILMVPSAILYIITSEVDLPSLGTIYHINLNYGGFDNYLIYVHQNNGDLRFNGPFLEPGHLGMIGSFIMMANNFRLNNRYIIIILISIILSLSLAGYMLVVIGYILCTYYKGKIKAGRVIFVVTTLYALFLIGQTYNGGDNVINREVISRFESDDEKGIVGNNRASYNVMILFEGVLENRELLLYGYDREYQRQNEEMFTKSNGLVFFIVKHGIIGVLVTFSFYVFLALIAKNRKYALLFLLFIFVCFFQRTYYNWIPWILCYDYAIVNNGIGKAIELKKLRK